MSPTAVTTRLSKGHEAGFSLADLRRVLADAAIVTQERRLLPPAEAAFFGRSLLPPAGGFGEAQGIELSAGDLDSLRALAVDLIQAYLAGEGDPTDGPNPKGNAMHSAALQYVEALLRQEEIVERFDRATRDDSSLHALLRGSDRTRVQDFLLSRGGTLLDSLVNGWQRFVDHVWVRPVSFAYEEYEQGLIRRDLLENVISLVTPGFRKTLQSLVYPADSRFFDATREASASIRPTTPWEPQPWWWFRLPRHLGKNFNDRLGYLAPATLAEDTPPNDANAT
jgi:hypothetical protein